MSDKSTELEVTKEAPSREESVSKPPHSSLLSWVLAVVSFLFPAAGFIFVLFWRDSQPETAKKARLAGYIGAGVEVLASLIIILLYATKEGFVLGTWTMRQFLFWLSLLITLEAASVLVGEHFFGVRFPNGRRGLLFTLGRIFGTLLTIGFALAVVYTFDAIMPSVPKGFPFDIHNPQWSSGSATVPFYGIFILIGAFSAYLIASNKAYEHGHPRDIFDDLLFIAFPMGLVGARLWWVISEWNRTLADSHTIMSIIDVRSGGLAVEGGVLLGALVGIWYVIERKRRIRVTDAMDFIVPGILIAQAIGRLGNFTNVEVYGAVADPEKWSFLPQIITNQMMVRDGVFHVPLFLIEGLLNVLGYFIITYALGKGLKKWLIPGDLCYSYFIWYGTIRAILEPLRDPEFIMGTSVQMSIALVVLGVVLIIANHLYAFWKTKPHYTKTHDAYLAWAKKSVTKIEALPRWAKILLALPVVDGFFYGFYRVVKGHVFSGIVWIVFGPLFGWILDLICLLMKTKLVMSKEYVPLSTL